ncbi:hypothetical protein [Methylocella sp.]|uniref:hypothetical protein n=1 Tax=Methylocella sp. TaxID=1978226 RepID=UPI0037845245
MGSSPAGFGAQRGDQMRSAFASGQAREAFDGSRFGVLWSVGLFADRAAVLEIIIDGFAKCSLDVVDLLSMKADDVRNAVKAANPCLIVGLKLHV